MRKFSDIENIPELSDIELAMIDETYSEEIVDIIWNKAKIINGVNPDRFRRDDCGALISRLSYEEKSEFGWQIFRSEFNKRNMQIKNARATALHWKNFDHRVNGKKKCHLLAQPIFSN